MIEDLIHLDGIIRTALEEDLGAGDLTTDAIVDPKGRGKAVLLAREDLVLAGWPVFQRVFELISSRITVEPLFQEGDRVPAGKEIGVVTGPFRAILLGERTALNFLQRMSGIATLTRRFVEKTDPEHVKIVDTRKTAPGLRLLDKYAVRMGGGFNHRIGLFDGILIKDNHIVAAGSVKNAVTLARKHAPHTIKLEVEVEDMPGVEEALEAGADVILLDNMTPEMIREAVQRVRGRVLLEASGGIDLDTVEEVAQTGVNIISIGALTHSPRAVDVSLELHPL